MNPATPIEKRRIMGNPSKRALPEATTSLPLATETPKPPAHLGKTGVEVWNSIWTYARAWLSPTTDIGLIVRYCEAWDERAAHRAQLVEDGYYDTDAKGKVIPHPAISRLRALDDQLTRWAGLMGMTPADRARLGFAEVKRVSKLEQLFADREHRSDAV
jgi:P27 family predicted phage terminase small subunit